jgi:hypothetical protein
MKTRLALVTALAAALLAAAMLTALSGLLVLLAGALLAATLLLTRLLLAALLVLRILVLLRHAYLRFEVSAPRPPDLAANCVPRAAAIWRSGSCFAVRCYDQPFTHAHAAVITLIAMP